MKPVSERPATGALLVALIYELLEAHADTIELRLAAAGGLHWAAHIDYLRALHRTAERMLAEVSGPEAEP